MNKTKITASLLLGAMIVGSMPIQAFATPQLEGLTNEEKVQVLDNEIVTSMEKVESLTKSISEKEMELNLQYEELVKTNEEYKQQKQSVNIKSNSTYKNNNLKMLDLILGSSSISEFFQNLDLSTKIIKENNKTLKLLDKKEEELVAKQDRLEKEIEDLNKDKKTLEEEKVNLENKKKEIEEEIVRLEASIIATATSYQSLPILDIPASESASTVLKEAFNYLGTPYVWGGTSPSGFDCSGFVQYVFKKSAGISLPRVSQSQQNVGTRVSMSEMQPGDLVFFGSPAYHVGIYIGNGQYIHAPRTGDVIKISQLNFVNVSSVSRVL